MRIGEFAKKYNMNPSAIRYYIDKALLTPKRERGQYVFDASCMEQMERIVQYKRLEFSLEEIEILSYYESATNLKDKAAIEMIVEILSEKVKQVESDMDNLQDVLSHLHEAINTYQHMEANLKDNGNHSVPLEAMEVLYCPKCDRKISLKAANINEEGIQSAELHCDCGYKGKITDGYILCEGAMEETPFKIFENVDPVLGSTDDFSSSYRMLIDKGHLWMYQKIALLETGISYALAGPFSYNFMPKYMQKFRDDVVYIFVDISVKKLQKLQRYFGSMKKRIIYIAGTFEDIPIKKGSVDLYIDDFSMSNCSFTYNKNVFKYVSPLLGGTGKVVGTFVDYSKAPKSLENFKEDVEAFDPKLMSLKRIYQNLSSEKISISEKKNFGSPEGWGKHFARQAEKEKVSLIVYEGEKDSTP